MKAAVMQPYFFPYIGYFQLLAAVDVFVILDDVNFIKRGWINRNNILLRGAPHLFSLPLEKASQNRLICETKLNFSNKDKDKFLKTIQVAYKKATHYSKFYEVLESIIWYDDVDLTSFIHNSFDVVCSYLDVDAKIVRSSKLDKNDSLKAQERIIEICKIVGADLYINPPGGKELYVDSDFEKNNINLKFIVTNLNSVAYKQFGSNFVPRLSFIDVLMFNSKDEIKEMLQQYHLA